MRIDAKYCSAVCRKASSRRKDQIARAASKAIEEVGYIRKLASRYPDLEYAAAVQLERIRQALETNISADVSVTVASVTDKPLCPTCHQHHAMWDSDLLMYWCFNCSNYFGAYKKTG